VAVQQRLPHRELVEISFEETADNRVHEFASACGPTAATATARARVAFYAGETKNTPTRRLDTARHPARREPRRVSFRINRECTVAKLMGCPILRVLR
jgi:hypothetical protein